MATFLTTSKMNPALAARVEASVTGRPNDPNARARKRRRATAIARVLLVVAVTWTLWGGFGAWRRSRHEVEAARTRLLARARSEAASLTDVDKVAAARVEAWLVRMAGPWDGDFASEELRDAGLAKLLDTEGSIYLRAPIEALSRPSALPGAAASSMKDSLLFCLADPPSARTEAVLLDKVRTSYGDSSAVEAKTSRARRYGELLAGMPFLLPPWSESVVRASDGDAIARLQRDFDRAPIARAKEAARARLLVVAVDEASTGSGPTELDGERPHAIRLFVVDRAADRVLLRARKPVDPSWISVAKRPHYARGLDGCAFAFDVHEDAKKQQP